MRQTVQKINNSCSTGEKETLRVFLEYKCSFNTDLIFFNMTFLLFHLAIRAAGY